MPKSFRQWDVFMFPFSKERRHPAVIISNDETCQNADIEEVNALICTSAQVNRGPKPVEEVLDENDGLDWKTMVRCDKIFLLPKGQFDDRKGSVSRDRRHLISRKIVEALRLPLHRP
ncbi:MAG TPA: type II toxin-antitoxin system PemK/MazF family toxin [Verrucomicrobiae bacterium]|nr:type II toxin-antitoxin system PemK/MazF family toxin [Verrucomicrobiae bacterium]